MRRPRRTQKRRSESKPPGRLAVVGIVVGVLCAAFLAFGVYSIRGVPGVSYEHYYADIPDIGSLGLHNQIRMAGTLVGQTIGVTALPDGHARVDLQLYNGTGRLPAGTKIVIRANGLLGERYVQLVPGTGHRLLPAGSTLRAPAGGSLSYGVPEALNVLDAPTRTRLGQMLRGLGGGLAGQGPALNDTFHVGPGVAADLQGVSDSILARPGAAQALLPSMQAGMSALDGARTQLADMFSPAAEGIAPFYRRSAATEATLAQAPSTLSQAQSGLASGTRVLRATQALSQAVNRALPDAPRALADMTALMAQSPVALKRTAALLRSAGPAVPATLHILDALDPDLQPLRSAFDHLQPIVSQLALHGCDVVNFAHNWTSVLAYGAPSSRPTPFGDAGWLHQLRVNVLAGSESLSSLVPAATQFAPVASNPYGAPCSSRGPVYTPIGTVGSGA